MALGLSSDGRMYFRERDQRSQKWGEFFRSVPTKGGPLCRFWVDIAMSASSHMNPTDPGYERWGAYAYGVGGDGTLWVTFRNPHSGEWSKEFANVRDRAAGGPAPGHFKKVSATQPWGSIAVAGLSNEGEVWITDYDPQADRYSAFKALSTLTTGGPGYFVDVAIASFLDSTVEVVGLGSDGKLWHTARVDDRWPTPLYSVASQVTGGPEFFTSISACTDEGARLHLFGVGSDRLLWHTMRYPRDGHWQSFWGNIRTQVPGGPSGFIDSAAAVDLRF